MQRPKRYPTPHAYRVDLYRRQGGVCWLCGQALDLFQSPHRYGAASLEHVIPRGIGGSDSERNAALTHYECNCRRGDRLIWKVERPTSLETIYEPRPWNQRQFNQLVREIGVALKFVKLKVPANPKFGQVRHWDARPRVQDNTRESL